MIRYFVVTLVGLGFGSLAGYYLTKNFYDVRSEYISAGYTAGTLDIAISMLEEPDCTLRAGVKAWADVEAENLEKLSFREAIVFPERERYDRMKNNASDSLRRYRAYMTSTDGE